MLVIKRLVKSFSKRRSSWANWFKRKDRTNIKNKSDEENKKSEQALKELLEWKYDYIVDTTLPTKSSVTKIKQEKLN